MKTVHRIGQSAIVSVLALHAGLAQAAPVSWTGAGDGVNWTNPANWSSNPALPGPTDDVTINVAGTPTITLNASASIRSLNTAEALVITGNNITLSVATTATATANVTLDSGGRLSGGAWDVSAAALVCSGVGNAGSQALIGTAVTGDILLNQNNSRLRVETGSTFTKIRLGASSAGVGFATGYVINGEVVAEGGAGTRAIEALNSGSLTLGASGIITAAAGFTGTLQVGPAFWYSSVSTFTNSGAIRNQSTGSITVNSSSTASTGTLSSTGGGSLSIQNLTGNVSGPTISGAGSSVSLSSGTYTINSNTNVGAGATLSLGGAFTNTATINLSGTLNINGGTTAGLGTVNRTGGVYAVTGALNNTGNTLALSSATGDLILNGGSITGGSVTCANGTRIVVSSASGNGQLTDVAITGDVVLDTSNARVKVGGTTSFTNLRLAASSTAVGVVPGYTLNGTIIAEGGSGSRNVEMNGNDGTFTIGASGSIVTSTGFAGTLAIGTGFWFGGNMTLANNGLIASDVGNGNTTEVTCSPLAMTSAGTLRAKDGSAMSVSGLSGTLGTLGTLTILDAGTSLTLNGSGYTLGSATTVPTGTTLTLNGSWTNASTITLAGRLNIGGGTTAGLGTINRTGGSYAITGTLDNTGNTLALTAATGDWILSGTLSGGNVTFAGGARLVVGTTGSNARLLNVTVQGDVILDQNNARLKVEGATTFNNLRLAFGNTSVGFGPGTTLSGNIIGEGTNTGGRYVEMNGTSGTFTIGSGSSIIQATNCGGALNVGQGFWFGGTMKLVNNGTIAANAATKTLTVSQLTDYSGSGTLTAAQGGALTLSGATGTLGTIVLSDASSSMTLDGTNYALPVKPVIPTGATLTLNGSWSATNSFNVNGGTLNLGGTVTYAGLNLTSFQRTGGSVNLTGTLDNTGNTLTLNSTTGSWTLLGGTISGGSLAYANGSTLLIGASGTNRLLNVNLQGELLLTLQSGRVKVEGTTRFTAARFQNGNQGIGFSPGYIIQDPIFNESTNSSQNGIELNGNPGTLTIAPGVSITSTATATNTLSIGGSWWFGGNAALVNNGTISLLAPGRTHYINPATSFSGSGTINVGGGTLNITAANGSMGTLNLSGTNTTCTVTASSGQSYSFAAKPTVPAGTTLTLNAGWALPVGASLTGGIINLDGTFTTAAMNLSQWTRAGGTLNITGTLNNTGATLALNATTGPVNITTSGTLAGITGGSVTQSTPGLLGFIGDCALTDVNVTPEVTVSNTNARIRMMGATSTPLVRLTGSGAGVGFQTGATMNTAVLAEGTGARYFDAVPATSGGASTLTIGASGSVLTSGPTLYITENGGWFSTKMTLTNNGLIGSNVNTAGVVMSVTDLTNYDRASKTLTGGSWRIVGTTSNNQLNELVTLQGGGSSYDPIVINTNAADVTLGAGNSLAATFANLTSNSGTLELTGRTLATSPVGGTFTNSGALTLTPSARLNITGAYTQSAIGTYNAQIGGTQASGAFGQINASGAASLAGTLNATFTVNRACGNIYSILTSTNRTGTWSPANIPPSDVDTVVFLFYPGNDARLAISTTADFNLDGFVTFEDFDEFVTAFENGEARADFNQDGFLSFEDFDAFIFRFEALCQ